MERKANIQRKTAETDIRIDLKIDGAGKHSISTGIGFLDHMLTLFAVHGFFDLTVAAKGDLEVDFHHTAEDVGLVLGDALDEALGDRKGIRRYGHAATPMDEVLTTVTVDLSKRPYFVCRVPPDISVGTGFNIPLAKELLRAFATRGGMNLHVNVRYGENEHHIIESMFKAAARALDQASGMDPRIGAVHSTKGVL